MFLSDMLLDGSCGEDELVANFYNVSEKYPRMHKKTSLMWDNVVVNPNRVGDLEIFFSLGSFITNIFKAHSHQVEVQAKAKSFFEICHSFFNSIRFRLRFHSVGAFTLNS